MADPGSVLAIVGACVTAGKLIFQIQDYYSTANDTLTAMAKECTSLRDVLYQVEQMGESDHLDRLESNRDFRQSLERALTTCNWSLTLVTRQLKRLNAPDQDINPTWIYKWSRMAKFKFLWRGSTMKEYLGHLRAHVSALSNLMVVYNARAVMDFNENFVRLRPQIEQISNNVQSLLHRNNEPVPRQSSYVESILQRPRTPFSPALPPEIPTRTPVEPPLASASFLQSIKRATRWSDKQIMKSLREIRGFGDADDYVLACEAIAINGHDLSMALTVLRQIRSHGSAEDYSEALLIVASYEENLQGTLNWLSRIRGLGTQADYSMALTTTRTHCFAFGEVEDTLKWFRSLGRDPEDYSRTLRFLRSRSYVFSSTKEDLLKIQERSRDANRYSRALRLLEENDFSIQATLNKLGNNPPHQQPYNPPPPFAQPQHPNQLAPPPPFSQQPPRAGSPFRGGFLPMVYGAGAGPSPRSSSNQAPQQQQRPPAFPIPRIGAINAGAIGGDRPRWLRKLFPQDREREEVKRRGRNIEADVQGMCEALGTLDLKGADLVHLGQVLKYTGFDCVKTKSQMLDLASILPDKQDFAWALGFLSRLAGGWPTMQAIFGPDNVDVRFTVTFFRTEHISVDDVLDYLNKDAPKGEDAQRCVLRLWRRQRLSKQGIIGQVNQLRRMVNFNNNVFQAFLYLLEENDFDQDVTRNQWRLLVDAMGGEAHYRCAYRMEVYALPGLKESGGNADDTVHAFCQLQEFSRSGYYSTASETDNHDAALELVRLADFNFQDVIGVLYDYQELAQRQSRVVGGLPVLLKLVRDGNYNIARAHKTIAYLVGPAVELTDEQALRLLERHNYNRDVAVSDHRRNGIVH